ncbi:MAG: hypothetical protein Q7I97_03960 [Thermovirgaceae bacterium]|nr:hypothetical protein [Thermovirgaceae bacterium]
MRKIFPILVLMALPLVWIASGKADVVKKFGSVSFAEMMANPRSGASVSDGLVSVTGPDGQVFLLWESGTAFLIPAGPFLEAGLDTSKLPGNIIFDAAAGTLLIGDAPVRGGDNALGEIFNSFLKTKRPALGYHGAMDHFGLDVGGEGKFEWAIRPEKNDKDVVFILDPRPLERAGLRPLEVKGWALLDLDVTMNSKAPRLASLFEIR